MSIKELADWNVKQAEALEERADVEFFKDTAHEFRKRAAMHRATADALLEK